MSEDVFSAAWYRVSALRPRVRAHARIHRHDYRDEIWFVLEDRALGRSWRFTPIAYHFIGLLNGERTVDQAWQAVTDQFGDDAPTQDEAIHFLGQLHAADVLQADVAPDTLELFRRGERQRSAKLRQRLSQPLSIRIPLFDPDRFLARFAPLMKPLFGWFGALAWLVVVTIGAVQAGLHWPELSTNLADRVLTPGSLLMLWLAYPLIKTVHELGHGFAARVYGGEVHEIGVMFLVFMPVPYVEASSASTFRSKYQRMTVGAAGILVELLLAAIAIMAWVSLEPGLLRTFVFNVALIGGVSTVLFNGNPLLRFDGYYVLADAIEIPNLATRSRNYLLYLAQRRLFGMEQARDPATGPGERRWFVVYGVASFVYRMIIMVAIALFVASQFFFVGVLIATWVVIAQIVLPLGKGLVYLLTHQGLHRKRLRASVATLAVTGVMAAGLSMPLPAWTRAQGVVWLPEEAQVRAGAEGTVTRMLATDGDWVSAGAPLIETGNPFIESRVTVTQARLRELGARLQSEEFVDRTAAEVTREAIASENAELQRAQERLAALTVRSPVAGRFAVPDGNDLTGKFARRGELLGYVVAPDAMTVRVVVEQDDIGQVRERTQDVALRLPAWGGPTLTGRVEREVPAGGDQLPSAVLSVQGGGPFTTDPTQTHPLRTRAKLFQLDVSVDSRVTLQHVGARVHVRFGHGAEALGARWYRQGRQLLLSRFGV